MNIISMPLRQTPPIGPLWVTTETWVEDERVLLSYEDEAVTVNSSSFEKGWGKCVFVCVCESACFVLCYDIV